MDNPSAPLLSVIVPVYNSAAWLRPCLDSICNQSYRNLEILCVNDCSPDNSADILAEYAARDPRIRIIEREQNGGVAAARNSGLDAATGEFITFVDPDDTVDLNAFGDSIQNLSDETDLVCYRVETCGEDTSRKKFTELFVRSKDITGEYPVNLKFVERMLWTIWAKIYRKSIIDRYHMRCLTGIWQDDLDFYFRYLSCCRRVTSISGASYRWLIRSDSTSAVNGAHDTDDLNVFTAYDNVLSFVHTHRPNSHQTAFMQGLVRSILFHVSATKSKNKLQAIRRARDLFRKWKLGDVETAFSGFPDYRSTLRIVTAPWWQQMLIRLSWLFYEPSNLKIKYRFFGLVIMKQYLYPVAHRFNLLGFKFGSTVDRKR